MEDNGFNCTAIVATKVCPYLEADMLSV